MLSKPATARGRERAEAGEELDQIYEQHVSEVHRWVRRLLGPGGDVPDLIHDVFVVAVRRRAEFRGDGSIRTWLFRITMNVVRNRRRRARLRAILFDRYGGGTAAPGGAPVTPLEDLERREQIAELYAALDRLPDKLRTPLILFELEGMTCETIGEMLGVSVGATWVRLHRGRARLSSELAKKRVRR
jgi:RNA polymerase sigma-70 factor (ECF subfamily)